ncbi:MAG: outer membrane beta-barrel protein [Bacteroidia bacterium]
MKILLLSFSFFSLTIAALAQKDSVKSQVPFEGQDQTWQNGSDRRDSAVLSSKYVTGIIMVDANCTFSGNNPNDHTVVGSTALARNNEMEVSAAVIGGEFNYNGARGRILTQFGTRSTIVPRNDFSPYRGQYKLADEYRYISEAYGGYHFNVMHGINVDAGMFMSYVGLNSYYQCENWEYQASFTSDNTPWFFNGVRTQIFPSNTLKIELWLINGWQSYGMFNEMPGFGGNITWSPKEYFKILTNDYYGADAAGLPGRHRFHSDNSMLVRLYNRPKAKGVSRVAFSLTGDIGDEKGDGVNGFTSDPVLGPAQNFMSAMFYGRIWFHKNKFAWTFGGGVMTNPGRYLVLYPTGDASPLPNPVNPTQTEGTHPFSANPGDQFSAWDCSTNICWMPNQSVEFRLEWVHREASVDYFAGPGGVTSPTGYTTTPLPSNWAPDLEKAENRIIFAMLFRL